MQRACLHVGHPAVTALFVVWRPKGALDDETKQPPEKEEERKGGGEDILQMNMNGKREIIYIQIYSR